MCHSTGLLPIGIIGLGNGESAAARILMPSPPQNKTTFMMRLAFQ
jgi:hypothetical protein